MTLQECAIIELYTGICMCTGDNRRYVYEYAEKLMGRPVYTHEFPELSDELKDRSENDFIRLCKESIDEKKAPKDWESIEWIRLTDKIPEQGQRVLVCRFFTKDKNLSYYDSAVRWWFKESFVDEKLNVDRNTTVAWLPIPPLPHIGDQNNEQDA